jgi:chromosome transmission fidelity protein 18
MLAPMLTTSILEEPTIRYYIPPNKPQIKVNFYKLTPNGVNVQARSIEVVNKKHEKINVKALATRDLLSKPIKQLIEEARITCLDKDKDVEAMEDVIEIAPELWVDKYNPKHFIELITDERVNRELLVWMKSWDKIVFPKKCKVQKAFYNKPSQPVFKHITT